MRRVRLGLLLPLLLVLSQQGALLHELRHAYYAAHASRPVLHDARELADASLCVTCHAFNQVTHAADGSVPLPTLPVTGLVRAADPGYVLFREAALAPRSRGPPRLPA